MRKFIVGLLVLASTGAAWAGNPWYTLFEDFNKMNVVLSVSDDSYVDMSFLVNRPSWLLREGALRTCFKDNLEVLRDAEFGPGNFQIGTDYRVYGDARVRFLISLAGQGDSCKIRVTGSMQTMTHGFWVDDTTPNVRDHIRRLVSIIVLETVYPQDADRVQEAYKNGQPLPPEPAWRVP